ncbi:hypothetical protein DDB_G0277383 [Dictyostelium discoideum AX4]|uniref:Histone RNA hairpin-binding protein RNA-binding domain-containing protein n=1 Tax=Dictyostelium discoideum TaxID=44689 RepID=Q75J91_DICDI|nr:hypothetical protein DDB_G0277383 [Dictyostelium discoideum AX4]EAL68748.1 hypothetical protein DDB_G0277383 [Dictyostelium discoideum AX4]|eukprot:XP_642675.1 hypothetical protein DDB_G0277383 [Dictyostelium discoideum AX4]
MSSSTIITPIATTTTNNNSSTNGIHNSKTNRTLFKNIKNNIPNSPNNAPIKKNSVGIIGNGPNVNNNNKDRKLNSNDGVNFGKKNILFTPSKNSMVSTTKHSSSSSSLLAKNEYDIESIKKELKSMDISTGGISPLSSPLRESSPISTIDLESITATTTKLTDAFVAASSSSSSVKYTIDVLLSFKSANTKRPIQIDIVENHQKEIVVPLSLPTTPYNNNNNNNNNTNNSSQHNTANGQKYPIFSPQISPFKIAYAQSSSTKTNINNNNNNNNITPTKKANSNITTPQSNNRNNHYNSNTKSSTKKQNPIPFSLNTATPNQKNTTTTPSKKSTTTTPKSNKKINDVNAAFAAVANSTTTTEQPVAIIDGATPSTNESPKKTPLKETDPKRLAARQRQIDIGKMTAGYKNYIALVPKSKRKPTDPKTPNKNQVCSKRSWDGQIKKWRRQLHENYDWTGIPFNEKEVEASNNESTEESTLEKEMNKLEISEENENHNN